MCFVDCLAGQYFHWSHGECEPCPLGQYQDAPGMTYCNLCAANSTSADDRLSCGKFLFFSVCKEQTKTDTCANSVDPDEMACNKPSHQDLHCLPFCF